MRDYKEMFGYEEPESNNLIKQFILDLRETYKYSDPVGKLMLLFRGFLWVIFLGFGLFGLLIQLGIVK